MEAEPSPVRIGSAERDRALSELGEHMRAGRIDPSEYAERAERAATARYESELAVLFEDLPATSAPPPPAAEPFVDEHGRRPLGGRAGATIAAVTPIVAIVLFFVFGAAFDFGWSWMFFLLIPAVGAVVYGGSKGRR